MKKVVLLWLSILLWGIAAIAQPSLITYADFESGVPTGWNTNNSTNVTVNSALKNSGARSIRLKNSTSGDVWLETPTLTRNTGCKVRIEFDHIPMLQNPEGQGEFQISINNGQTWMPITFTGGITSPTGYDPTYGGGIPSWGGSFFKTNYWGGNTNILEENLDSTYWRHEVFYLNSIIGEATTFKLRFKIGQASLANTFSGWYIDDFRVYQGSAAGNNVRIPQLQSGNILAPRVYNYPNCTDVRIDAIIGFLQSSAPTVADSIYVEYKFGNNSTISKSTLRDTNGHYIGYIPFNGFDSITYWRIVANDVKYNKTTYPYSFNKWNSFKSIRSEDTSMTLQTTGISNQEIMIKTNSARSMYQFRYKASELRNKGFKAGKLFKLGYKVTNASGPFYMTDFSVYITNLNPSTVLSGINPYAGNFQQVMGPDLMSAPPIGEQELVFDNYFIWDGESDILIKTCWDNGVNNTTGGTTKIESIVAPAGNLSGQMYSTVGFAGACNAPFNTSDGQIGFRPNFKFIFKKDCTLNYDAGVNDTLVSPSSMVVNANTNVPITIKINNYGSDTLNAVRIYTQIDDNASLFAGTWNGMLPPDTTSRPYSSINYTLPSGLTFTPGYRHVKIWTDSIINQIDWEPTNDTAIYQSGYFGIVSCNGPLNGVYAIGNVTGITTDRTFGNFKEAFAMLKGCGISGPVTFKVLNLPVGTFYTDTLVFPINIVGASITNYIKFTSASPAQYVNLKPIRTTNKSYDFAGAKYLKFEKFNFYSADSFAVVNDTLIPGTANIIEMNNQSSNIEFKDCGFMRNPNSNNVDPYYFVNIGAAKYITIDSCRINGKAVFNHIIIQGNSPTSLTEGITIKKSTFTNFSNESISINYSKDVVIEKNEFINNLTTSSNTNYNIMISSSKNFSISKNKFLINNVSAIGVNLALASTTPSVIANNKISIHNNNTSPSTSNIFGINFMSGNDVKIAYNNIYARDLNSDGLLSFGMAIGNGSTNQPLTNISIKNNIVVSDGYGVGVHAKTTTQSIISFSNNIYYKLNTLISPSSTILWRYNTTNCSTLDEWNAALGGSGDLASTIYGPLFPSFDNLSTTNTYVCYKGTPISEVLDDNNYRARNTTQPCIGADEFSPPPSNIYVMKAWIDRGDVLVASDGNTIYSACGLENEYINIQFKNISNNTILANNLKFWYKIDNLTIPNIQKDTIHYLVIPDSVYTYRFRNPYNFGVTTADREFKVTAFSVLAADTIRTNDTAVFYVNSRIQLTALPAQNLPINYGDSALLSITSNDSIYWFLRNTDEIPVLKTHTYQTNRLYNDTTFYFSRKEEIPMLKISEIQISKAANAIGQTANLPAWVTANCAIELSNYGNGAINLNGHQLSFVSGNSVALAATMTKTVTFGDYLIYPNTSVVLQFANAPIGTTPDSLKTLYIGSISFTAAQKAGFLIKDATGTIIDAVTYNGATFNTATNVPTSVWTGPGKMIPNNTAGLIRTNRSAVDSNGWTPSISTTPLTISTLDTAQIWKRDNGCFGFKAPYNITVSGIPTIDPGVASIKLVGVNRTSVCTLTDEQVEVEITNTGVSPCTSTPLLLKVYDGTTLVNTVYDTCNVTVAPNDTITYIIPQTINLASNTSDKTFNLVCHSNHSADVIHLNDTARMQITSLKTPYSPIASTVNIPYATTATLTATGVNPTDVLIWYNSNFTNHELDRITYTTPILYENDTFYVGSMLLEYDTIQLGDSNIANALTAYPSPFNGNVKNVKEQYLYKASELSNLGLTEGNINSIMFDILSASGVATLTDYSIKIGTTNEESLTTWITGLTEVFNDTVQITNSSANYGWRNLQFADPFYYDGTSNLIIEICFSRQESDARKVSTKYSATSFNSVLSYRHASTNACIWTGSPTQPSRLRPNTRFNVDKFGCSSVRTPVAVNVAPAPDCEAGLTQIVNPSTSIVMSGISIPIDVKLKNYGSAALTSTPIHWKINDVEQTPYTWTGNLAPRDTQTVNIGNHTFISGINTIQAWTNLACDSIYSNDTVEFEFSACIGNSTDTSHFTIGTGGNYTTINDAVSALISSGICGHVVFDINPKVDGYNEQITIPLIAGTENGNTITFRGNAPDSNDVFITYNAGTNTDKYVLKLDGTSNVRFENLRFNNFDTIYTSVVEIANNSSNINFNGVVISSSPRIKTNNEVTNLINITGINNDLSFNNMLFNGGAVGLSSDLPDSNSSKLSITNSFFKAFAYKGIDVKGIKELYITQNKFREYANANISSAIAISNISNILEILKNDVYLEGGTAVRIGFDIKKVDVSVLSPALIANNSISLSGIYATTALNYVGLNMDSVSNTNIYYNTIKVRASNNSGNSKSLNIGTNCSRIKVLNNNLDNSGKGFAYYVTNPSTQVMASNNNNYISNGLNPIYWSGNKQTVTALQTANSQDAMSISAYNPFESDSVLNIIYPSEVVRAAEPLDGLVEDILGNFRPMSPRPTIGAYEFLFSNVDFGPTSILAPDSITSYLENDPMTVSVRVKNFGLYGIDSLRITAVLKYNADTTNIIQSISESFVQNISSLTSVDFTLTNKLYPPLHFRSVNNKLHLCIYTTVYGDTIRINDTIHSNIIIIPAYNMQALNTVPITDRCKLFHTPVQITIKNVGEKPIGLNDSLWMSYQVEGRPDIYARELLLISTATPYNDGTTNWDAIQKSQQLVYTFNTLANFYPLGLTDTTWRLRTIVSLNKDNVKVNDTSAYITVNSRVSPPQPITHDTAIHYGTWAEPWASQINSLPIKWYADSTSTPFYSPTAYAQSMKYRTSQLFTDSTFYLRVNLSGSFPCESYYTPIRVTLLDRSDIDGAAIGLEGQGPVEPPLDGWVYMTAADTIKVKVSNYGTMPMQNFDITYSIQKTTPANSPIINVTERCTQAVAPDGHLIYKFDSLADFSAITNYKIRAWVDVPNDSIAVNDTSSIWLVKAKNGNTIYPNSVAQNANSLDITRVQMGNMDNASNNSGIAYTDYTNTITPVTLFKGIYDSIYISCDKPSNLESENAIGGWTRVFIDWDRNGIFEPTEKVFDDTIWSDSLAKGKVIVPANTLTGYTRMRVMIWQGRGGNLPYGADESPTLGEVEDYKVLVRNTTPINAELVKFTQPGDFLNVQNNDIRVVLRNTGTSTLNSATINWTMNGTPDVLNWNGSLAPAERVEVTLRANAIIPTGLTQFVAWVDAVDDPYHLNDTIRKNTYIIKTFTVPYKTEFDDEGYDDFYAPNSNPLLPDNCWEFGTPDPANTTINGPYSTPNCWKTKLTGRHPENNESILYSPIFDIGLIKPDTMTFMMRRAMNTGTFIYVDYKKYGIEGEWARLGVVSDPGAQNWYNNDSNRFQGNAIWTKHLFSLQSINRYLGNSVQFRFVFRSSTSVNDGVAIDNFEIKRALRPQDAGVVQINLTPSETPTYGSTFYPKVIVRNYGSEKIHKYTVCYTAYGMHIPRCEDVFDTVGINPQDTAVYTFAGGRVVFDSLPNNFNICAFTRLNPTDLYSDNDSLCEVKRIGPLQRDVKLIEILEPAEQVVANNDINVVIHIKNIGIDGINQLPVAYKLPGHDAVVETITFSPALFRNEEYHYTFNTPFHSSYGTTNLKVWTALDGDYYRYNDTLFRRVLGAISTQDIEAKYVTIDDYGTDQIGVQLSFSNNSSVGIDSITVGYYYNGDRTNAHEETFRNNGTLVSGQMGHHYFAQTLPRANAPYHGICGYVKIGNDNNRENDTTCTLYMGIRDAKADTIHIENTSNIMSKVQLRARNIGTLGVPIMVNAGYVINGDWLNPVVQSFDWTFGEPNSNQIYYMTFAQRIPRVDNGAYNIVAWVDYPFDANRSNDTTMIFKVVDIIGLDDEPEANEFTLSQNVPNPLNNSTTISFSLPNAGNTRFMVINNMGQLIISENKFYSEGKHEILLDKLNLPQGIYYYAMEFEGKKITKKMVVTK
ncbi:MAG: hypothetical protein H6Q16_883 [Bacteroidetes bacterium]|nr:hypothetical protein [Bacteroidota bacterium]